MGESRPGRPDTDFRDGVPEPSSATACRIGTGLLWPGILAAPQLFRRRPAGADANQPSPKGEPVSRSLGLVDLGLGLSSLLGLLCGLPAVEVLLHRGQGALVPLDGPARALPGLLVLRRDAPEELADLATVRLENLGQFGGGDVRHLDQLLCVVVKYHRLMMGIPYHPKSRPVKAPWQVAYTTSSRP